MRKPIIAGNWKMNKTVSESVDFAKSLLDITNDNVESLICVPFASLTEVKKIVDGSGIKLGAQNMHETETKKHQPEV